MHFNFYDASHQLHHCSILLKHDIGDKHYILFMDENNGDEVISARIDDEGHLFPLTNGEMEEMQDILADTVNEIMEHGVVDITIMRSMMRDALSSYIWNKMERRPMIMPIIMEV